MPDAYNRHKQHIKHELRIWKPAKPPVSVGGNRQMDLRRTAKRGCSSDRPGMRYLSAAQAQPNARGVKTALVAGIPLCSPCELILLKRWRMLNPTSNN